MASRPDTLKIAQADMETISSKLGRARLGRWNFIVPEQEVEEAVTLLERNARRLRQAFGLNGKAA